jgi:hypothetical protein
LPWRPASRTFVAGAPVVAAAVRWEDAAAAGEEDGAADVEEEGAAALAIGDTERGGPPSVSDRSLGRTSWAS